MPKFMQIAYGVVEARQITDDSVNRIQKFNTETACMEEIVGEVGDWIVVQGTQVQIIKASDFDALYHPVDKVIPPIPPTELDDGDDNLNPWIEWNNE